jgi:tyrosyl-tRNA synthetase
MKLKASDLATVAEEIPSYTIPAGALANGINIVDLLAEATAVLASKSDARRAIKANSITVNKEKITDHEAIINHEFLLHGKYLMLENGKKNKYMVVVE